MPIIEQNYKLEVFVNYKLHESGKYKYLGTTISGRYMRFQNVDNLQMFLVQHSSFPLCGFWLEKEFFIKCIFSSI